MTDRTKSSGQKVREKIKLAIINDLPKYCPNGKHRIVNLICFDFNLNPVTVLGYLDSFIEKGILVILKNGYLDLAVRPKTEESKEN